MDLKNVQSKPWSATSSERHCFVLYNQKFSFKNWPMKQGIIKSTR